MKSGFYKNQFSGNGHFCKKLKQKFEKAKQSVPPFLFFLETKHSHSNWLKIVAWGTESHFWLLLQKCLKSSIFLLYYVISYFVKIWSKNWKKWNGRYLPFCFFSTLNFVSYKLVENCSQRKGITFLTFFTKTHIFL